MRRSQELLLRAFMHVCNGPLHTLTVPSPAASGELDTLEGALYRPRAATAAATFEFSGRLQFWVVPESGMYRITACGAKAADGAYRCFPTSKPKTLENTYWQHAQHAQPCAHFLHVLSAGGCRSCGAPHAGVHAEDERSYEGRQR